MNPTVYKLKVVHLGLLMIPWVYKFGSRVLQRKAFFLGRRAFIVNPLVYKLGKSCTSDFSGTGVQVGAQAQFLCTTLWNTAVFLKSPEMLGMRGGGYVPKGTHRGSDGFPEEFVEGPNVRVCLSPGRALDMFQGPCEYGCLTRLLIPYSRYQSLILMRTDRGERGRRGQGVSVVRV